MCVGFFYSNKFWIFSELLLGSYVSGPADGPQRGPPPLRVQVLHLVLSKRCHGNRSQHDRAAPGSSSGRRGRCGGSSAAEEMQPEPERRGLEPQDCPPLGRSQGSAASIPLSSSIDADKCAGNFNCTFSYV